MIQFISRKGGSETQPLSHVTPRDAKLGFQGVDGRLSFTLNFGQVHLQYTRFGQNGK